MTTTEKKALQNFFNNYSRLSDEKDKTFKEIQDEVRYTGETPSCSLQWNIEVLKKHKRPFAETLYRRYIELDAKMDTMRDLGQVLADINFWK